MEALTVDISSRVFDDDKHIVFDIDGEVIAVSIDDFTSRRFLFDLDDESIDSISHHLTSREYKSIDLKRSKSDGDLPFKSKMDSRIIGSGTLNEIHRLSPLMKGKRKLPFHRIGSGTYGIVESAFPSTVIKKFTCVSSMIVELAAYELIQKVYPRPEDVHLPRILGHRENFFIMPNYGKELNYHELKPREVAIAIHSLHAIGIVHRDLKHQNVLLDEDNNHILIDFGLSSWFPFTKLRERETTIQSIWYRAPEVASSSVHTEYTPVIDEWSLGIMMESTRRMIYKPYTDKELKQCIESIFQKKKIEPNDLPVAGSNDFLRYGSSCRQSVEKYLGMPEITRMSMLKLIPVSSAIGPVTDCDYLLRNASSWMSYFAAIDYLCLSGNMHQSSDLAEILFNGINVDTLNLPNIKGEYYRLNTFFTLVLMYPLNINDFTEAVMCLSYGGNIFPVNEQVEWIVKNFILQEKPDFTCQDLITMHYCRNLRKMSPKLSASVSRLFACLINS